ncbi:MAG: hypothetical protein LBT62_00140 [Deltaproteobacteria bacterium]|nr:hypothetical protein [Deltaproteobacteria bacterium]
MIEANLGLFTPRFGCGADRHVGVSATFQARAWSFRLGRAGDFLLSSQSPDFFIERSPGNTLTNWERLRF